MLAKLHIESLATKNTVKAVRQALQHLPTDLNRTYDDAMDRINHQNEDDKHLARMVLIWVSKAKRPLSVAELREALAIEPDATALDADNLLDIDIILSVCAGLVIVDEAMSVVRLIHYTAQNYFDGLQTTQFLEAHTQIASSCLQYLSFSEFSGPEFTTCGWNTPVSARRKGKDNVKSLVEAHPLLAYSQYCLLHAAEASGLRLRDPIDSFLSRALSWKYFWRYLEDDHLAAPWNYPDW